MFLGAILHSGVGFSRPAGRPDKGNYLEGQYAVGGTIGQKAKNFRSVFTFFTLVRCFLLHFVCLSFPVSKNNKKSADKLNSGI